MYTQQDVKTYDTIMALLSVSCAVFKAPKGEWVDPSQWYSSRSIHSESYSDNSNTINSEIIPLVTNTQEYSVAS